MGQSVVVAIFLALGIGTELTCCLGILVMRTAFDRLHYTGPASTLGPMALTAAIIASTPWSQVSIKALLLTALLLVTNTVLTHATGRAAYIRRVGR